MAGRAAHGLHPRHQHHLVRLRVERQVRQPLLVPRVQRQPKQRIDALPAGMVLRKLAEQQPKAFAWMHGSARKGDGAPLLQHLAEALGAD